MVDVRISTREKTYCYRRILLQKIDDEMRDFLAETRKRIPLAVVGGSDLEKIVEQLGETLSDGQHHFRFEQYLSL